MLLFVLFAFLAALAPTAMSSPVNMTDTALTEFAMDDYNLWACQNVDWMVPCEKLPVAPGGSGACRYIKPGSVASRAKSFILPSSNRFPAWQCRFFQRGDCTGMDSCYLRDTRRNSGCRYTYNSYWCIDDLAL
ncbi:hypothetical protein M011DRAFT_474628 [Sporormia fimetaria CBS 119925]|uniref:Uncharacterized protein n=1 Tax=Sporormia fimetaria CBS 119925 TaxID=1340428 RepID=A0A6A6VLY0_9PLEO|nr:hypothetical protein M011DRAFT_474628 [Sporormia fimetaria CBS 119925]